MAMKYRKMDGMDFSAGSFVWDHSLFYIKRQWKIFFDTDREAKAK